MSIAEGVFANGVTEILKKLIPVIGREIGMAWGVKDDLKKLQETLQMVLAVIADAERRQQNEEAVRLWLRRLKDVAYDADDVMDDFSYEAVRRSERGNNLNHKARDLFSSDNPLAFRFNMAREIKHINQRLDGITKDMNRFQLQITPANNTTNSHGESSEQRSRQTDSSINESSIRGREDDKKTIISMLTKVIPSSTPSVSNQEKVSVVSIVGMGGLGKTTLAQLVYNDEMIKEQFKLRMWVHVSHHFDVKKLLTEIMESITRAKFDTLSNFDVLTDKVREELKEKKYLLVLDDLWNESDDQWEKLRNPLLAGAQGSKILITARKSKVADVVKGNIAPYYLKTLQDAECWSVIEKKAFFPSGAQKTAKMASIGLEIARKCCGLPLAAKFLGSILRSQNTEAEWLAILEDDKWNTSENQSSIMPVLKLSYDNLSPQLKQCFSYLCIFPKGWKIDMVTLVRMWIAEGYLDTCNLGNGKSIEDVGIECAESLVCNSFLDVVEVTEYLDDIKTCKMHDLVHDLAQAVSGDQELVSLKESEFQNTSKIRRLQLILDEDLSSTFLKSLGNEKKLRTLFIPEGSNRYLDMLLVNKHLRVLHLGPPPKVWEYPKVPSLSFKLRHLRYLHLTQLDLSEVVNDLVSIDKAYNLETLVFYRMKGSIENLLRNIGSLKKLRHLNISRTETEELPDSVTSLPNLHTLNLHMCKLKSLPESATGLKNLRFLDISCNPIEELPGFITNLRNLQILDVSACQNLNYLPEYVKDLDNLKIFDFRNCESLKKLPEDFGTLTQLRKLELDGTGIKVLPESCANLVNLEYVDLYRCKLPKEVNNKWTKVKAYYNSEIGVPMGIGKLVCLESLTYPVGEKLINGTDFYDGIQELGNLNSLKWLSIKNLQNVKDPIDAERADLKGKQSLSKLELYWSAPDGMWDRNSCNFQVNEALQPNSSMWDRYSCNYQVIEALQPHSGLRKLEIWNFMGCDLPTWMCVPSSIGQLQHLTDLDLTGLRFLKRLDIGGFPSLASLTLVHMVSLEDMCCSRPCLSLQKMTIKYSSKLTEIPSLPSLEVLGLTDIDHQLVRSVGRTQRSLKSLYLYALEDLIFIPMSMLQSNCNLQELRIEHCSKFQGFRGYEDQENENEVTLPSPQLHSGCSLQVLEFRDCPVLKFLPDLRGWTIRILTIANCPEVKESLTYDLKSLSSLEYLSVDFQMHKKD